MSSVSSPGVEEISAPNVPRPAFDRVVCKANVLLVFEDICPNYLEELAVQHSFNDTAIIAFILDRQEKGLHYPRRENPKKRKRSDSSEPKDEDGEIKAKLNNPDYAARLRAPSYQQFAKKLISQDFPKVPLGSITNFLGQHGSLYQAYTYMDESVRNWDENNPQWKGKKTTSRVENQYLPDNIASLDVNGLSPEERAALDELLAARSTRNRKDAKVAEEAEEMQNTVRARTNGEMGECGCCFDEFPLNRMVHCDGDVLHWFCRGCMKQHADTTIGCGKYLLACMSLDQCDSGFSITQRAAFIDRKMQIALDRNEQAEVLMKAGIENLETCPFCPFAMEYPPVEENREFRCANPECEITSCRLCRKQTHIPKSCAEARLEEGHSARHTIEEAMSDAVIRKCNKCSNPFIKENGCNKILCTRCRTLQCYVCRKTVKDYGHFNDTSRGGREGQCPLFDSTEQRHQDEARHAEEQTRQKVAEENPEVENEFLRFRVSDQVREDEKRRQEQDPRFPQRPPLPHIPVPVAGHLQRRLENMRAAVAQQIRGQEPRAMEHIRNFKPVAMQFAAQDPQHLVGNPPVPPRPGEVEIDQRMQESREREKRRQQLMAQMFQKERRARQPNPRGSIRGFTNGSAFATPRQGQPGSDASNSITLEGPPVQVQVQPDGLRNGDVFWGVDPTPNPNMDMFGSPNASPLLDMLNHSPYMPPWAEAAPQQNERTMIQERMRRLAIQRAAALQRGHNLEGPEAALGPLREQLHRPPGLGRLGQAGAPDAQLEIRYRPGGVVRRART